MKRINYARDINIGKHVWIGAYVNILKGVTIGDNSIIGIRSIVTKNIPQNCIALGVPAKVIRENVT
jgi:acetyltransferase-like isoleucine patch superfamily enzyme